MYLSAPHAVDFDITLQCNLRCTHCNVSAGDKGSDEMTTTQILSLVEELYDAGVSVISITGGEPLANPDWLQVVSHACSLPGWRVIINTNGILWSEQTIKEVAARCPSLRIAISMDGYSPESYARTRRRVDGEPAIEEFGLVLENVRLMRKVGIKYVGLNYVLTRPSIWEFAKAAELATSLDVDLLGIKFYQYGRACEHLQEYEMPFTEWMEFLLTVTAEKKQRDPKWLRTTLSVTTPWEMLLPFHLNGTLEDALNVWGFLSPLEKPSYRLHRDLGCGACVTGCAISPNGELMPCGTVSANVPTELCCGSTLEGFSKAWESSTVANAFRKIRVKDIGEPCLSCEIRDLCGGGCRSRAFMATGSLLAPDPLCPLVSGEIRR